MVTDQGDFFSEMYFLVFEEGFLYEAPLGVTDVLPGGNVRHGPWIVDECALVLSAWLDAGWLSLRRLTADGLTCLCPTDEGASIDASDWYLRAELALRR